MRGVAIILVVLSHTGNPYGRWYVSYFVQIFFMISGWLWKSSDTDSAVSLKKFVIKCVKSLYIPSVIANIVVILCNNLLIEINFLTMNKDLLGMEAGSGFTLTKNYSLKHIGSEICGTLLCTKSQTLIGALWFVQTLFIVKIVYGIIEFCCKKIKVERLFSFIIFIIYVISITCALKDIELIQCAWNLSRIGVSMFVLHMGALLQNTCSKQKTEEHSNPILLAFVGLTFTYISNATKQGRVLYAPEQYVEPVYFILCSLAGWFLIYGISELIKDKGILRSLLIYCGRNTMPIVILHLLAFKIVTFIQMKVYGGEAYMLAIKTYWHNEKLWWLAYAIVGIAVSLAINWIYHLLKKHVDERYSGIRDERNRREKSC